MKSFFIPALALLVLYTGCVKAPEGCFTVDGPKLVDLNSPVKFLNCSVEYNSLEWDFGDGTTSTDANPEHSYTSIGEFAVLLKVYDENKTQSDQQSAVIKVGKRYLSKINVSEIPTSNGGTAWDPTDDPDLQFKITSASSGTIYTSPENSNLASAIPFSWTAAPGVVELVPTSWNFLLLDVDGSVADTVGNWSLNLSSIPGGSTFNLSGTNLNLTVEYSVQ